MLRLRQQERVDWFRIVVDLERRGYGSKRISAEIEVPRSTIVGWKLENARPKFEEGLRLALLWAEVTGRSAEQAPRYNPYRRQQDLPLE